MSIKEKVINNIVYSMPYAVFNHIEDLEQKNIRLRNRVKELLKDCNSCNFHKYKQALDKIKKYCEEQNLKADYTACEVLTMIDEVLNV